MPSDLNPTPPVSTAAPKRSLMKLILALSLTLNLAVLAMMAGAFVRGHGGRVERMGEGFGAYAQALDRADRRALFREMRQQAGDKRADRATHLTAVAKALAADPFLPQALESAMAAQEAGMKDQITQAQRIILAHLTGLNAQERRDVAERLLQDGQRKPPAP
jgi:hypothetical protein